MLKKNKLTHMYGQCLLPILSVGLFLSIQISSHAESFSYQQAERLILQSSYTSQAQQALQQASNLNHEAIKGLGLPRIDLNARAYAFHAETDIPLDQLKQNLEDQLSQRVSDRLSELGELGVPSDILGSVGNGINNIIHDGINTFPDYTHLTLEDQVFRPTISMMMPIYTGGLIQSTKNAAQVNARRQDINYQQSQDIQRFELIQHYFNVQLQQQLLQSSLDNLNAMQQHLNNAIKLEQQGMISKGQRLIFEVAKNNADRLYQNMQHNLDASQYQLRTLLQQQHMQMLSTPLFINKDQPFDLNQLLAAFPEQSALIKKLNLDTQLAQEKVNLENAKKKPKIFAFGEYALDDQENWIVGIMASYNLFSGMNHNKQIRAAELQRHAAELMTERTKQEVSNIIYKAYSELRSAQQSHQLLLQNKVAAEENLRIQTLSFKEDMGTASDVIDAETLRSTLESELAINAYRYILSLATLLNSNGALDQFQNYITQEHTDFIRKTSARGVEK